MKFLGKIFYNFRHPILSYMSSKMDDESFEEDDLYELDEFDDDEYDNDAYVVEENKGFKFSSLFKKGQKKDKSKILPDEEFDIFDNIDSEELFDNSSEVEENKGFKFSNLFKKGKKKDKSKILPDEEFDIFDNIDSEELSDNSSEVEENKGFKFSNMFKKGQKKDKSKILSDEEFDILNNMINENKESSDYSNEDLENNSEVKNNRDKTHDFCNRNIKGNHDKKNIQDKLYDYLADAKIEPSKLRKILEKFDFITTRGLEDKLEQFIDKNKLTDPKLRYDNLMTEMDNIINNDLLKNEKSTFNFEFDDTYPNVIEVEPTIIEGTKSTQQGEIPSVIEIGPAITEGTKSIQQGEILSVIEIEPAITEGTKSTNQGLNSNMIEVKPIRNGINSIIVNNGIEKTKEDYYREYKAKKISAKELVDLCNKIDEKNQKQYDKKCEKEYKLYQERMNQILELNNRVVELKFRIDKFGVGTLDSSDEEELERRGKLLSELKELESMISALSVRIVVLEKRGYAREYEEKLETEKKNYVKFWENALFEQEKQQSLKKQSNCEMLETFTDEELKLMKENNFDSDSDIEAVMKFKNIMKM